MLRRFFAGAMLALLLLLPSQAQQPTAVHYTNITGTGTTVIKGSAGPPVVPATGILHSICFNTATATEVVTIWDNTAASGTKIGTITIPASSQLFCQKYDVAFINGLTVQTATASSDITVTWE